MDPVAMHCHDMATGLECDLVRNSSQIGYGQEQVQILRKIWTSLFEVMHCL